MIEGNKSESTPQIPAGPEKIKRDRRGQLTLFLGMAPGVGKTYAMLQAAQEEKLQGRHVLIGFLETHGSRATELLAKGLTRIPGLQIHAEGSAFEELNVDAIRLRQPHVVLVDELAHTNAPGSRHPKRYLDVLELLEAGMDVFATVNLQNVASEAAAVESVTRLRVQDHVPNTVLEGAEIRLVDLPPKLFLKRLREQMAYLTQDPELSGSGIFHEANLMTLRELAWRFVAGQVKRDAHEYMQAREIRGPGKSGHRLLAAINLGPADEQIIDRTRRLAEALNAPWIVLYVESPHALNQADRAQIDRTLAMAGELGAEVIAMTGDDFARAVMRIATQRNITQIVVGKSSGWSGLDFRGDLRLRRLLRESGNVEVHLVPVERSGRRGTRWWRWPERFIWPQYVIAISVVLAITFLAHLFEAGIGGPHAVALIYLLAVVVLGSFVQRGPTLAAATLSALLWDYFILSPVFEFRVKHVEDALLLGMYFMVALILGQLTTRNRAQQNAERLQEERATALYLLTRELNEVTSLDQILQRAVHQMERAFKAGIAVWLRESPGQLSSAAHPASTFGPGADEKRAGEWAFLHGQRAGKFTANLPQSETLFVPLITSAGTVGVIGLRLSQSSAPTLHQLNLVDAFCQQIAFALDRHFVREISERAKLLSESERLSKTLLNSMSHEIRTPIAVIKSAVSNLSQLKPPQISNQQMEILSVIQDANERLNRLVGNVLDVTRLESGHVKPRFSECDVADLINLAMAEIEGELSQHKVTVEIAPHLPIVPMDFVLMEQALINLLSNAANHTKPGTSVMVLAKAENDFLVIEVADRGPGIRPESLGRVFEKFYRDPGAATGGTGLGLSLVKGFVEAQGGDVAVKNRDGGGAVFTVRLPLGNIAAISIEPGL